MKQTLNTEAKPESCLASVICSACEGNGYTIEVEGECCWDADYIERYGSCCGIPNPVQVQVECRKCQNGYVPAE